MTDMKERACRWAMSHTGNDPMTRHERIWSFRYYVIMYGYRVGYSNV